MRVPLPPDKARRMRMFATGLLVLMAGVFLIGFGIKLVVSK